ncbi:MAG: glycoside hydrolase family 2 TIM barrel-domain containing protein [Chitinophagaceae bacterium]
MVAKRINILAVILLLFIFSAQAQKSRATIALQDGWKFHKGGTEYADNAGYNDANWETVSLPHTWNAKDPFDDDETYFRGIGWYRRTLTLDKNYENKKLFLFFEGANQVTDVYVNGAFAGQHKGGYTAFSIDITSFLIWKDGSSDNSIAIQINNAPDNFIPPLSVGYGIYGGIYRNMWLITTDDLHYKQINNAAAGVFVKTNEVASRKPTLQVNSTILNESKQTRRFTFSNTLHDANGKQICRFSEDVEVNAGEEKSVLANSEAINNPGLWSPETPTLYRLTSQLIENGKVVDEIENSVGFRWFRFDADSGFFLNGKKYALKGTNRHQDMQGKGSALSSADHIRDIKLIKNMGANFLRLAHYPQAPEVLRLADEYGLLIWEEIPLVNYMNIDPEFLSNAKYMIREMIEQHYNHPSIVMWGSMNEILLHSPQGDRIQRQDDVEYIGRVRKYAISLDSLVRALDPTRYSTIAIHGSGDYDKYNLANFSQVTGHNNYSGWYGGKVEEFGTYFDKVHQQNPQQNIFISEYGAGSDRRLNSSNPQRLDFTSTYKRFFHESYIRQINARPYLAGTAIWNQYDFSQPNIGGSISHQNQKGMMTWDRQFKDVYFLYKANWNPEPMIYIASRDWAHRAGYTNENFTVDIYTNGNEVTLYLNGKSAGKAKADDVRKATFNLKFNAGDNQLEAVTKINGKIVKDLMTIHYTAYPEQLAANDFKTIYINAGSNAQYTDHTNTVWLQDQAYKKGSYGFESGTPATLNLKHMVNGTEHTPMYYSYLNGFGSYKIDVPEGTYEVTLNFIEPEKIKAGERIFGVSINNQNLINNLDLAADYGFCQAISKSFIVDAKNGEGLTISSIAKKGKPILSGISVVKK